MLRRNKATTVIAALAVTLAAFHGLRAFAGVTQPRHRPAGQFVVVENLPKGMTCRAMPESSLGLWTGRENYGIKDERTDWDPIPRWQGEKTYFPSRPLQADENRQWYHFDAEGKELGWIGRAIARVLIGQDNPLYAPSADVGAFAVVTNCEKVRVMGKQYHYKLYFRNLSFRPGDMKVERFKDIQNRFPERIIMKAVWEAMAPTPKSRRIFKERLKLFTGPNHLYYNKDPVEYPMHLIKDCTLTDSLPKRLQLLEQHTKKIPMLRKLKEVRQEIEDYKKLDRYKEFLKTQLAMEGEGAEERLELDELALRGERQRMQSVLEEYEGRETPKTKAPTWIGTQIRKLPIKTHPAPNKGKSMRWKPELMAKYNEYRRDRGLKSEE